MGVESITLEQAKVPIRTDQECTEAYKNFTYSANKDTMFCAGLKEGGIDTCQGQFLFYV